ncbi:MFS transporter [Acerihabitans sp. TG2]|uniref:MFS transporter n=1 Tax=Acerihabitans sp. TG2 TaxID=3096008 RepID=UPI002B23551A|nr:MFS transporter [Acerihabitans sp. TG2]MEA9392374.1 MFS transporter [Acerihabitans sp. TG2]
MSEVRSIDSPDQTRHFPLLVVLCAGMFMAILDVNVITIAIVSIQSEFHASVSAITWAVDAYNLTLAGFMLCAGMLADRYGARCLWIVGVTVFSGASLACGLSGSIEQLIVLRLLQGAGAAMFIPASFSLMPVIWPDSVVRQRAIGLFGGIVAIAAAAGPILGGFLVSYFSWRSVFLINIPIGLCAIVAAYWLLPAVDGHRDQKGDLAGQCLGFATLAGISFILIQLPVLGWRDGLMQAIAVISLSTGAGFITVERYCASPAIPAILFRHSRFNVANLTGLLVNACYFGGIYVLSLLLQQRLSYSPLQTGMALLPLAVCLMAGNLLAGRMMVRLGVKKQMVAGLLLSACGYLGMLCLQQRITPIVIISMALLAGGTAFVVPPMTVTVLRSAPLSMTGTASAIHTTLRQIGSLLGIALASLAFTLLNSPLLLLMPLYALIHILLALTLWRLTWIDD